MIIKRLLQKEFTTTQQVAKKYSGHFIEVITHILKIHYGFSDIDENKHKADIINAFVGPIIKQVGKDKKITGQKIVDGIFTKELDKETTIRDIEAHLKSKYNFKSNITNEDFDAAVEVIVKIIDTRDTNKAKEYFYNTDEWKKIFMR